jgi:hypothetical protein
VVDVLIVRQKLMLPSILHRKHTLSNSHMSDPPKDRSEFWIRFTCSFVFFGFVIAIGVLRGVDSWGLPIGFAVWATASLAISIYAAKVGDEAWHSLLGFFRWWP